MKEKLTESKLRSIIKEELELLNEGKFYRLPKKVINNEVYSLKRNITSFFDSLLKGNDFKPKELDLYIRQMQGLKKFVATFDSTEDVPIKFK